MRCIAVAGLTALLCLSAPARADVLVTINKSQQQMTVSIDGARTYHWTVSTGRPGYETPSGGFRAIRLERVYYSKKFDDAPMPNSVFFHGGYAIHGTTEESRLGNPVSHGCVRLARVNAETLFALVRARGMSSTRVVITDGPLREVPSAGPMARERRFERDRGFEQFGARGLRGPRSADRRVTHDEPPRPVRATEFHPPRGDEASREVWLRSLDRKYGVNTR
jgi:hypothetical protein